MLPSQIKMKARPRAAQKTGKNSAFQAQCNHSHICCLLGQYSGCYRCSKFLTLLLKCIAFFGFTVSWAKKWGRNTPWESPVPLNDCVAPLQSGWICQAHAAMCWREDAAEVTRGAGGAGNSGRNTVYEHIQTDSVVIHTVWWCMQRHTWCLCQK